MSQELAIIKHENIQTIVSAAPQSYKDNKLSRENCEAAGQSILNAIVQGGMTDELDQRAAQYIEKVKKTIKKMNERRSPVTKLFDDIRKEFTQIENAIDPTKSNTIPYQIQQLRNQYAAKKRAEEEDRRRKEYERQQAEITRKQMKLDIEEDLKIQFSGYINSIINALSEIDRNITLVNYEESLAKIQDLPTALHQDYIDKLQTCIRIPAGISVDELRKVEAEVKDSLKEKFCDQYAFEVEGTKQYILDRMPSRKAALERLAKASDEEVAHMQQEMEARQRKEAEMREAERRRKEEEERQQDELARKQVEMDSLFAQQASAQSYQPKVKVAQKINILSPEGVMIIVSMWWSKEGCTLSIDELQKIFKRQISFCEKLAKEGIYISDESVEYVEDVKAR